MAEIIEKMFIETESSQIWGFFLSNPIEHTSHFDFFVCFGVVVIGIDIVEIFDKGIILVLINK